VERVRPQLEEVECEVALQVREELQGMWDRGQLERLVTNLLTNASKYGAGGQVDVAVTRSGEAAQVTVRDRGIGIAEDQLEAIFEPYCRAVCPRKYDGVGLGLFIVKGIAEAHGGQVQVESAPDKGARFTVTLPLSPGGQPDDEANDD